MVQYSGDGRERLITANAATSTTEGFITLRQGPCPLGFVWEGSVTITGAPSGALFNASVASTPWGQWAGPTNFGPVQLWGNETLVVQGVGLERNTQYSMLFVGVALPEHLANPLPPVAPLSTVSVETSTLLIDGATFTGANFVDIRVPSLTRRLTMVINVGAGSPRAIALVGNTTGATYGFGTSDDVDGPNLFYFAIEPTVDATYRLSINGSATFWVTANTTSPLIITADSFPIDIAQPVLIVPAADTVFDTAGSPVGAFGTAAQAFHAVGTSTVIAAPGSALSIYIQSISCWNASLGVGAVSETGFLADLGPVFAVMTLIGGTTRISDQYTFPGGFQIPDNTPLMANVVTNGTNIGVTYTIGRAL